uniref:Reverse transcriptase domain-containing protein n=1 Tax=Panagrellus redivivus TaxID=6233 RepID=A0A7E4VR27_PANRE
MTPRKQYAVAGVQPGHQNNSIDVMKPENPKPKGRRHRFHVCTFNCRSIASQERMIALEQEADRIRFDVIGLSETRKPGRNHTILPDSGRHLYTSGNTDGTRSFAGVGFLISPEAHDKLTSVNYISNRLIQATFKLEKNKTLRITQVYAPTSNSDDDAYLDFLDKLNLALSPPAPYDMVVGDFNACVGAKEEGECATGKFAYGERNPRGQMLVDFCEADHLFVMNSRFKKHQSRKWTWQHPNGASRTEIDFVMCRYKCFLSNVSVIPSFAGSDHRLVRATVDIKARKRGKPKAPKQLPSYKTPELKAAVEMELARTPTFADPYAEYMALKDVLHRVSKVCANYEAKTEKISQETKDVLAKRRRLKHGSQNTPLAKIEYAETCKLARKLISRDIEAHYERIMVKAIQDNQIRKGKRATIQELPQMAQLNKADGTCATTTDELAEVLTEYYGELYADPEEPSYTQTPITDFAPLTATELKEVAKKMKPNAAPGLDHISSKVVKATMNELAPRMANTMQGFIQNGLFPSDLLTSNIILLPKKGNAAEIKNYRPISLLPVPYKTLTRVLTARTELQVRRFIPKEQAGFRRGFSTVDHVHVLCQLLEKCREWLIPCFMCFIDSEKAFDRLKRRKIYEALDKYDVDHGTSEVIKNIYANGTAVISLGNIKIPIKTSRGVRQGDSLSPLLFLLTLQSALDEVDWEKGGIQIGDEKLSWLGYADDIVLIASSVAELQSLLEDVSTKCEEVGLKMNATKTKWISTDENPPPLIHNDQEIERVNEFVYLGRLISYRQPYSKKTAMHMELSRRISAGWMAFRKVKKLLTSKTVSMTLKRKYFDQCILPAILYACETWTLTKNDAERIAVAQRRMERAMLGVKLSDKKSNEWIRLQTGTKDVVNCAKSRKEVFASKLKHHSGDRWTTRITNWTPDKKRPLGRPPKRWRDDLPG